MPYDVRMLKETAIKYFGSQAELARALGIKPPSISDWKDVIPEGSAYKLQVITKGKLKVDPALYLKEAA